MRLVERNLRELSQLEHEVSGVLDDGEDTHVLVVAFRGEYKVGSGGNADAAYMRAIVASASEAWDCLALILDLRELEYSWGGALLGVIQAAEQLHHGEDDPPFPVKIVASDSCGAGILSLFGATEAESSSWLFRTLEEAVASAREAIRPYLDE